MSTFIIIETDCWGTFLHLLSDLYTCWEQYYFEHQLQVFYCLFSINLVALQFLASSELIFIPCHSFCLSERQHLMIPQTSKWGHMAYRITQLNPVKHFGLSHTNTFTPYLDIMSSSSCYCRLRHMLLFYSKRFQPQQSQCRTRCLCAKRKQFFSGWVKLCLQMLWMGKNITAV